ncbi:hypothetical protein [Streptomyces acidicola]|uniref:hypothetical protein n=1 Tax=Streptomyces acidicola TaxID=2596892 RepID=UPI00380D5C24
MTDDGLRTPAVDRIIRSRRTPPPRQVTFSHAPVANSGVVVGQDERVRRLRDALRAGSVPAVTALCQEFDADQLWAEGELAVALADAHVFLERQRELRGDLVQQLRQAVAERSSVKVRSLLVQVETVVGHDRSKDEDEAIRAAGTLTRAGHTGTRRHPFAGRSSPASAPQPVRAPRRRLPHGRIRQRPRTVGCGICSAICGAWSAVCPSVRSTG